MRRSATLLAAIALLISAYAGTAEAAGQHHNAPVCPSKAGQPNCPGDPTCVMWPDGDCHNDGHTAAFAMYGCTTDLGGTYHYAWGGMTFHGIATIRFHSPLGMQHKFYNYEGVDTFVKYDAAQRESADYIWMTEFTSRVHGGSLIQVGWMECCDCKKKGEAQAAYRAHILPQIKENRDASHSSL
jgi:hypothetical protein